jgi:hypothetical protein
MAVDVEGYVFLPGSLDLFSKLAGCYSALDKRDAGERTLRQCGNYAFARGMMHCWTMKSHARQPLEMEGGFISSSWIMFQIQSGREGEAHTPKDCTAYVSRDLVRSRLSRRRGNTISNCPLRRET